MTDAARLCAATGDNVAGMDDQIPDDRPTPADLPPAKALEWQHHAAANEPAVLAVQLATLCAQHYTEVATSGLVPRDEANEADVALILDAAQAAREAAFRIASRVLEARYHVDDPDHPDD